MARRGRATGRWLATAICLLVSPFASADAQPGPLPSPLTLDQALGPADAAHPDVERRAPASRPHGSAHREAMAESYVTFDKSRERHRLG